MASEKFAIESISYGMADGGMSCSGWHPGPPVCEVKVSDNKGNEIYLSLTNVDGFVYGHKTEESTFLPQVRQIDDYLFWDKMENSITLCIDNYRDPFEVNKGDEDFIPFFKFMANIVCPDHFSFDISDITINTDKVFIWPEEEYISYSRFLENFGFSGDGKKNPTTDSDLETFADEIRRIFEFFDKVAEKDPELGKQLWERFKKLESIKKLVSLRESLYGEEEGKDAEKKNKEE